MESGYPQFDGFSLNDDTYISTNIEYRSMTDRNLRTRYIARKPGARLIGTDFGTRTIRIQGHIIGSSHSDLQDKIDDLHSNVTRKEDGLLYISTDRYGTATAQSIGIGDPHYTQDYVPFDLELLMVDPFFYNLQHSTSYTIASGNVNSSLSITISGSVFAEPEIIYNAPAGSGQTTTSGVIIEYDATAESVTWSGTGATTTLAYGDSVSFDYNSHKILEGTEESEIEGFFSRWEPGYQTFTVTFSGTACGGTLNFNYNPRYL